MSTRKNKTMKDEGFNQKERRRTANYIHKDTYLQRNFQYKRFQKNNGIHEKTWKKSLLMYSSLSSFIQNLRVENFWNKHIPLII